MDLENLHCLAYSMSQQISQHIMIPKRLVCTSGATQAKSGNNEPDRETVANSNKTLNDLTSTELSEEHMTIHKRHREACEAKKRTYIDSSSGYKVFTEFAHLQRGKCCGTACRHCPYGQVNVKDPAMKKHFNSLFYV